MLLHTSLSVLLSKKIVNDLEILKTIYCNQAQEKRDKMMVCHYQLWTGLMIHEAKKT
jgi:hypothetical protein